MRAVALHDSTFVWSDGRIQFTSTADNQFLINAGAGVGIGRNNPTHPLHVGNSGSNGNGAHVTVGGVWTNGSSRLSKRDFTAIDPHEILQKVSQLDIQSWAYVGSEQFRHIGPVAEDFYATFGLGGDEQYIGTVDADGVALAAIKALQAENQELRARVERLELVLATSNKN